MDFLLKQAVVEEIKHFPSWHLDAELHFSVGTWGWRSHLHSLTRQPFKEPPMSTATRDLTRALVLAESDLGLILEYRALLLPEHLRSGVLDVWRDIQPQIADLRTVLLDKAESIDGLLSAAGLTGPQLDMKLSAHRLASDRARAARPPQAPQPPVVFRKLFKSLLGWINVWLGSLVAAIGAGEAIKEFKEFLEQGVDDAENFS